jgi:hypothetical protein
MKAVRAGQIDRDQKQRCPPRFGVIGRAPLEHPQREIERIDTPLFLADARKHREPIETPFELGRRLRGLDITWTNLVELGRDLIARLLADRKDRPPFVERKPQPVLR